MLYGYLTNQFPIHVYADFLTTFESQSWSPYSGTPFHDNSNFRAVTRTTLSLALNIELVLQMVALCGVVFLGFIAIVKPEMLQIVEESGPLSIFLQSYIACRSWNMRALASSEHWSVTDSEIAARPLPNAHRSGTLWYKENSV